MTNKRIIALISIIIITTVLLTACYHTSTNVNQEEQIIAGETYTLRAEVISIDKETDTAICESQDGNAWEFYGAEDWRIGDYVLLLMSSNKTTTIYDDSIISVRFDPFSH